MQWTLIDIVRKIGNSIQQEDIGSFPFNPTWLKEISMEAWDCASALFWTVNGLGVGDQCHQIQHLFKMLKIWKICLLLRQCKKISWGVCDFYLSNKNKLKNLRWYMLMSTDWHITFYHLRWYMSCPRIDTSHSTIQVCSYRRLM
jgi:hypothetical protein